MQYKLYFWNKDDGFDIYKADSIQVETTKNEVLSFIEKMKILHSMVYSFENDEVVFYRCELLKVSYSKEADGKKESRQNKLLFKVRDVLTNRKYFVGLECERFNYNKNS